MIRTTINKFIVILSNRLQLDVRYFLKGGAWLSLPLVINYLLGFVRTVAFARLVSQTTYGKFGFVNSAVATLSILSLPGISTALIESVARGNHGSIFVAAKTRARWGSLVSLGLAGVAAYYFINGDPVLAVATLIAGLFQPLTAAFQIVTAYYSGRKRFDQVSLINIELSVTSTLALLLFIYLNQGLVWLVIVNSASQFLIYFLNFLRIAREAKNSPRDSSVVSYGKSLTWASAISSIAFQLDSVILGFSTGFTNVALYNIASVLPKSIKTFMKMVTPLSMPKIAEQPSKRVYSVRTRRHLLILLLANIAIVLGAIVFIPFVISLLYGDKYAASIGYAQLLMLSLIVSLPGSFFMAALQARKQTRAIYNFNVIYGILQISTLAVLIPLLGITGIILSRIITRIGSTFYQWYAVSKI